MARFKKCFIVIILLLSAACTPEATLSSSPPPATAPPSPSLTATFVPWPTATPEPEDTGWRVLVPGVEWRRLWADSGAGRERLQLVRLDPTQVYLRVVYEPQHPRRVGEWAMALPEALIVINAGYFSKEMQATGLLISDGISSGRSYDDFAGMLAVGADRQITLRWLRTWPLDPNEVLVQAVQSFPVLVKPGGVMGFPPDADEGQRARRTVVAQDTAGRIMLLVSPAPLFSLHELAVWLTESDLDLDLDIALNLDGGTSTGLWIRDHDDNIDSLLPLPAVIAVELTGQ